MFMVKALLRILIVCSLMLTIKIDMYSQVETKVKEKIKMIDSLKIYENVEKVYRKVMPEIKKVIVKHVGPVTKKVFNDDRAMRIVFNSSYEIMPLPVRMIVSKSDFTNLCMKNKKHLVDIIPD